VRSDGIKAFHNEGVTKRLYPNAKMSDSHVGRSGSPSPLACDPSKRSLRRGSLRAVEASGIGEPRFVELRLTRLVSRGLPSTERTPFGSPRTICWM